MTDAKKDVLLTGASGTIGDAIARQLARQGYTLHLTSREPGKLESLKKDLSAAGAQVFPSPSGSLVYGQSITDGCIDWETTERIVLEAAEKSRAGR